MLKPTPDLLLRILYVIGAGFILINLREFFQYYKFTRLRKSALLTWAGPRPPLYRLFLWVGAVLAVLVFYKLAVLRLHPKYVFGETMMLVYYVYALPLGTKINRGFYEDGIWTEGGFVPYANIGGLAGREGPAPPLVLLYHLRTFARPSVGPGPPYRPRPRVRRA